MINLILKLNKLETFQKHLKKRALTKLKPHINCKLILFLICGTECNYKLVKINSVRKLLDTIFVILREDFRRGTIYVTYFLQFGKRRRQGSEQN